MRAYFERNATARLAMAFYYQEFILALPAAQAVPMMNVIIALDLSGEGAVPTKRSYSGASSGKNAVTPAT